MATKLYLHNSTDSTSGLPSSEQSTQTAELNFESQTTNNVMNTNIGSSQVERSLTQGLRDSEDVVYFGRWVSPGLNQSSIAANTWTWNFAASETSTGKNFPVSGTNSVYVNLYVWRPSNSTKIATILDGNTNADFVEPSAASTEKVMHGTFSGAAVASGISTGDRLIFEPWVIALTATSATFSIYFDGTTENTTENTTVSNHASFLETPENISFQAGGGPIDMTNANTKTYSNKFITKV